MKPMKRRSRKTLDNGRAGLARPNSAPARPAHGGAAEAKRTKSAKAAVNNTPRVEKQKASIHMRATAYCFRHFPTLWTIGKIRWEKHGRKQQWRIAVVLRYPTGYEKELGELLFDGKDFAVVTPRSLMNQRAQKIADDPTLHQEWNDYRGSSLPAREA